MGASTKAGSTKRSRKGKPTTEEQEWKGRQQKKRMQHPTGGKERRGENWHEGLVPAGTDARRRRTTNSGTRNREKKKTGTWKEANGNANKQRRRANKKQRSRRTLEWIGPGGGNAQVIGCEPPAQLLGTQQNHPGIRSTIPRTEPACKPQMRQKTIGSENKRKDAECGAG